MQRFTLTLVAVVVAIGPLVSLAAGDGMMMPDLETWKQMREEGLIHEPTQEAVIYFDNGKEELIIKVDYDGPADRFAWVIPVPARPEVELADVTIFYELQKLAIPMVAAAAPEEDKVKLLERKVIGEYDVSVLSATDGEALMKWLADNKYHLPEKAIDPIQYYVKKGWTFVACRIDVPDSQREERKGGLTPLKFTFATKRPIYPIELSSANPAPFDLMVYLILPRSAPDKYNKVQLSRSLLNCGYEFRAIGEEDRHWLDRRDPRVAKLTRGKAFEVRLFYWAGIYAVDPRHCTSDLVWTIVSTQETIPQFIPHMPPETSRAYSQPPLR